MSVENVLELIEIRKIASNVYFYGNKVIGILLQDQYEFEEEDKVNTFAYHKFIERTYKDIEFQNSLEKYILNVTNLALAARDPYIRQLAGYLKGQSDLLYSIDLFPPKKSLQESQLSISHLWSTYYGGKSHVEKDEIKSLSWFVEESSKK